MLSFDSSLTTALTKSATISYWLLRLYYNDESAYTGIAEKGYTIGGVIYYGLASFGSHNQTLNIDQFTTSNGTMQVKIDNNPNKIEGGRFSDLFATNNYSNRKWELFQCDENADFHTDNLIAGGIISSDIKPTPTQITMYLNDYWAKYNIELPLNRVTTALYSNAPEKNIGEPIPIMMGDFDTQANIPAATDFERHFPKGRVPAIIVDKGDSSADIHCLPDTDKVAGVILNQLNAKNVFMHNDVYQACNENNVTVSAAPANAAANLVKLTGNVFYAYYPHLKDKTTGAAVITDATNIFDSDFTTLGNAAYARGQTDDFIIDTGEIKNTGLCTAVEAVFHFGTFTGSPIAPGGQNLFYVNRAGAGEVVLVWNTPGYQAADISANFTTEELEGMTFSSTVITLEVNDNNVDDGDVDIYEAGFQLTVNSNKIYIKQKIELDDTGNRLRQFKTGEGQVDILLSDVELLFISGKGREYGSWIDARSLPYADEDLNENPVFMIEEIARNEMGISSLINTASFNTAGDEDGDLENAFGENTVEDIKFAFSQPKLIFAKPLIEKIGRQCGSYTWWGGDEFKIKTRRRTYTSVDFTIDFKDVKIIDFGLTPMTDVFNYISVDYDFDYGANKTIKSRTKDENSSLEDSISQGLTVDGYNQVLKLNLDMPYTLDQTTADNYGEALLTWLKDRKQVITIQGKKDTARLNKGEVGDIINFSNWDSNLKVLGDTVSTANYFMVTQITKSPDGPRMQVTEVDILMPSFSVYMGNSGQSIPNQTNTSLNWATKDTNGTWNDDTFNLSTDRFTPLIEGRYIFTAHVLLDTGGIAAGNFLVLLLYKNGDKIKESAMRFVGNGFVEGPPCMFQADVDNLLDNPDYFEMYVHQVTGGAHDTLDSGTLAPISIYCYWQGVGLPTASAFSVYQADGGQQAESGGGSEILTHTDTKMRYSGKSPLGGYDKLGEFESNKFTATIAGQYLFSANAWLAAGNINPTELLALQLWKNGSKYKQMEINYASTGNFEGPMFACIADADVGDYFELYIHQQTDVTKNTIISGEVSPVSNYCYFQGTLMTSSMPSFSVYNDNVGNGSAQEIAASTYTKVEWENKEAGNWNDANFELGTVGVPGATENRFTPLVKGKYLLIGKIWLGTNLGNPGNGDILALSIYKNGSQYKQMEMKYAGNTIFEGPLIACIVDADGVDDYFELWVTQGTGAAMDIVDTTDFPAVKVVNYFQGVGISKT